MSKGWKRAAQLNLSNSTVWAGLKRKQVMIEIRLLSMKSLFGLYKCGSSPGVDYRFRRGALLYRGCLTISSGIIIAKPEMGDLPPEALQLECLWVRTCSTGAEIRSDVLHSNTHVVDVAAISCSLDCRSQIYFTPSISSMTIARKGLLKSKMIVCRSRTNWPTVYACPTRAALSNASPNLAHQRNRSIDMSVLLQGPSASYS